MKRDGLLIWTVYDHPTDYPDAYIARLYKGELPTATVMACEALPPLRRWLAAQGLTCLARADTDDPAIVECWL